MIPLLLLLLSLALSQPAVAQDFPVGIVASDDPSLSQPVARDRQLTANQVHAMTARALELIGGMGSFVPDTARTVLIKPNISIARASGTGIVTDARVVRSVALLVHEAAPRARILIGEGAGGWVSPSLADCTLVHIGAPGDHSDVVQDGFEIAGHRETVRELRGMGIDIDVHDLNFDPAYKMQVPGGGLLWDEYEIASTVIDADVWINVPVAKTHGSKITCCMKNHYGIFPGLIYGWNKSRGTPDHKGIPHWPRTLDESWVDLVLLSKVDLNVVDMIQGTEGGAFQGTPKRSNLIVAGADPIATDLVVAQLMGFNPDDFEYADLGAQRGIGPGLIDNVDIRGGDPQALSSRFAKAGIDNDGDWGEHSQYGMGPRRWILLGPLDRDDRLTAEQMAQLSPLPGRDGWSPVVWFGFDKIDLDRHFDDPVNKAVYAFTHFTMATADSVRFWIGSDEGLQVWIDGQPLYEHKGRRRHLFGNDKLHGYLEAGEYRLLVRAEQSRGRFDFSFNICEPIDDVLYAGNRYPGVRYYQAKVAGPPAAELRVRAKQAWDPWRIGRVENTLESDYDPVVGYRTAPDSVMIETAAAATHALFEVIATQLPGVAVWGAGDTLTSKAVSRLPFAMGHMGIGKGYWAPAQRIALDRVLGWAGISYWLSVANGLEESGKAVAGWLAQGRIPLTGHDDGWEQVSGYRKTHDGVQIYSVRPDTTEWHAFGRGTWGRLPGRDWLEAPVLVVEQTGPPLEYDDWIDSTAAAALELARAPWTEYVEDWGSRGCPAGLAAWDAWVIDWERLPWTTAWAREPTVRNLLGNMARGYYQSVAGERTLAGAFFSRTAERSSGDRRHHLQSAAAGYTEAGRLMQAIRDGLPESRSGVLSEEDSLRQVAIGELKPLLRRARDAERRALSALVELLEERPLAPVREDPLLRRDRGRQLFVWTATLSKGVYNLSLSGETLTRDTLRGRETEGEAFEVLARMVRKSGWEVAIEVRSGKGQYYVLQQPTKANDWVASIRVDDEWTEFDNATELVVWAVPAQ